MEPKPYHLLIVGSNGYLGKKLLAAAHCLGDARGTSSHAKAGTIHLDLANPVAFDYLSIKKKEVLFLTASISEPDVCASEHDKAWAVNVQGTSVFISRVLDQGARVVFFSRDTVYGEQVTPCNEAHACRPVGDYATMKHAVEKMFLGHPDFKAIRLSYVPMISR
mgnify:CR=1 FL=1